MMIEFKNPGGLVMYGEQAPTVIISKAGRYVPNQISHIVVRRRIYAVAIGVIALVSPYVIIGAWTRFREESSTSIQRGFTMAWLVYGQILGFLVGSNATCQGDEGCPAIGSTVILVIIFGVPAIGGLIVVGQMVHASGSCMVGL
jgi:hypothetical protein